MTFIKYNVAQLLREPIGARRTYTLTETRLPLDDTLVLRNLDGTVDFIRTASGVYARITLHGQVRLECVRSLELFDHPVELTIQEELHSIVDVLTGVTLQAPIEEDPFYLDDHHMADVGELIREYTLLALPLSPVSEPYRDTPVRYSTETNEDGPDAADNPDDEPIDERLQVLRQWAARQHNPTEATDDEAAPAHPARNKQKTMEK